MAEAAIRKRKEPWSCETFGDLGGGDRLHTLQRLVGGVKYVKENVIGFSKVALYNDSLHRTDGRSLWVCFKMQRVRR
jgi:hypothetical protein